MSSLRRCALLVPALIALLATPAGSAADQLPEAPGGFKLRSSNGYSIVLLAAPPREGRPGEILMLVNRRGAEAIYAAPATVADTSIQASLGELGEIDVDFQPSGRKRTQRSSCNDKPVSYDDGYYEGKIEFNGEEGYTQVGATRARGDIQFALDLVCPGGGEVSGSGPGLPGAALTAGARTPGYKVSFEAGKNGPATRARFSASIQEKVDGVAILRGVETMGPANAFDYDPMLKKATVAPPSPFSGKATFRSAANGPGRWTGSLSVDFPGRSGVSLTAGSRRANLVHARWEHPRSARIR